MALVLPLDAISSLATPRLILMGIKNLDRYSRSGMLM